jgi:hypothetical protein
MHTAHFAQTVCPFKSAWLEASSRGGIVYTVEWRAALPPRRTSVISQQEAWMGIQHRLRIAVIVLLASIGRGTILARPVYAPSLDVMTAKADLVVIATPTDQRALPDKVNLPGVMRGNDPIPAIEVETTFAIQAVLHGQPADPKTFVFVHYREANPPKDPEPNAPALVDFTAKSGKVYLMFLHRDADGRYSAFNGQTDPAWSIKQLDPATP